MENSDSMVEAVKTELTNQLSNNTHMNPSNYNDSTSKSFQIDIPSIAIGNYYHYNTSITKSMHN